MKKIIYLVTEKWMSAIQSTPILLAKTHGNKLVIRLLDQNVISKRGREGWVRRDDLESRKQRVGMSSSVTFPEPLADAASESLHTSEDEL